MEVSKQTWKSFFEVCFVGYVKEGVFINSL